MNAGTAIGALLTLIAAVIVYVQVYCERKAERDVERITEDLDLPDNGVVIPFHGRLWRDRQRRIQARRFQTGDVA